MKNKLMKRAVYAAVIIVIGIFIIACPQPQGAGIAMFDAGEYHSIVLSKNGSIWSMGESSDGELGLGSFGGTDILSPTRIGTLNTWVHINAGAEHNFAIKDDGTLWGWGKNDDGQVGTGTTNDHATPRPIGNADNWEMVVAAGAEDGEHSLGIKEDNTLWSWGDDTDGQLGNGAASTSDVLEPEQVGSATDWMTVQAGDDFSVALKDDNSLWTWGYDGNGRLGNGSGSTSDVEDPTQIDTGYAQISAGDSHVLAVKTNGELWGWGYNSDNQIDSSGTIREAPIQIGSDSDWDMVAAGEDHSLALKTDGTLYAWGDDVDGQLGNGTAGDYTMPTQIGSADDWVAIKAGDSTSRAVKEDGTLWGWGANSDGQIGDGTDYDKESPTQIYLDE